MEGDREGGKKGSGGRVSRHDVKRAQSAREREREREQERELEDGCGTARRTGGGGKNRGKNGDGHCSQEEHLCELAFEEIVGQVLHRLQGRWGGGQRACERGIAAMHQCSECHEQLPIAT